MSDHISQADLNALADGELSTDQLSLVNDHLAACPACTSAALVQTLLKTNVAKAGQRYAMPAGLEQRLKRLATSDSTAGSRPSGRTAIAGWATAAAILLVIFSGLILMQQGRRQTELAALEYQAQVNEVSDLHIATLAAGLGPQVVSSDRHTVKPWFQGKLPFSFNLPDNLPGDTKLDGANLTYLHNQPVAQLLYTIGRHHVSVFLTERRAGEPTGEKHSDHSGYKVTSVGVGDLDIVAVSDVDPARLAELVSLIKSVQTGARS
jgi:anti-sigma factor RsiW